MTQFHKTLRPLAVSLSTLALLCLALVSNNILAADADVAAALNHPDRPVADAASDAGRMPEQVLSFAGLETGMDVFEIEAGGGYYTEILSRAVGDEGSVVLHHPELQMVFIGDALDVRTANNRLSNVRVSKTNYDQLDAADNSMDLVTWILGPHELGFAPDGNSLGDPETSFAEIARILKPGGVFLAIDHDAVPGSGLGVGGTIHRGDEAAITRLATDAGLTLAASSDLLKNPDDDLTVMVFNPQVRGKTSRFMLRFEK